MYIVAIIINVNVFNLKLEFFFMNKQYWGGCEDHRNSPGKRGNSFKESRRRQLLESFYGFEEAQLELEAHQRPSEHISSSLEKILKMVKLSEEFAFAELNERWHEIVGASMSTFCKASHVKDGVLYIAVSYSTAMHTLEKYHKQEILQRVKSICKNINQIRFIPSGSKI